MTYFAEMLKKSGNSINLVNQDFWFAFEIQIKKGVTT
jgi:hypothetical protein